MPLTPSQADVLRDLGRRAGATADEIVAATGLPPKGVGWILNELCGRGLVAVEQAAGEAPRYSLTPRGVDALAAFGP